MWQSNLDLHDGQHRFAQVRLRQGERTTNGTQRHDIDTDEEAMNSRGHRHGHPSANG